MDEAANGGATAGVMRQVAGTVDAERSGGRTPRLRWYWRRLSRMSAGEVGYRLSRFALSSFQRTGMLTAARTPVPVLGACSAQFVRPDAEVDPDVYLASADRVLAGCLPLFSMCTWGYGKAADWNRDPLTGVRAPMGFGKGIDYRNSRVVGNIKYLWEPNRHLQLVTLAQAYALTRDPRYGDGFCELLESWLDGCPYLRGPNWTSSLELGIRLINWSIAWQLIGGASSELFAPGRWGRLRVRWLNSIYQHCHFIRGHLSRYSSANNHLIGEAAGLVVAGFTWPYWAETLSWADDAGQTLELEVARQNTPDGVNREQAISYQTFVFDLLVLAGLASESAGRYVRADYWERVEAMAEFVAALMDKGGHVPMIGDADDARASGLDPDVESCPYRSMLALAGRLFDRQDFRRLGRGGERKAEWVLGRAGGRDGSSRDTKPVGGAFREGGYYLLGMSWGETDEIHVVIDAGPLGYRSIAAHGHADALSMTLNVGGREFLVDPGTYAYHTERKWRDYFRGTSAHNTVRVDGVDQAVSGGSFMWSTTVQAMCEKYEDSDEEQVFVGRHDGYFRLPDPVLHRRRVRLGKDDRTITVTDSLLGDGEHEVEGYWHFSEECVIECEGNCVTVRNGSAEVVMRMPGASEIEVISGDEIEPLGWISRRFGVRQPTSTVRWRRRISGPAAFVTTITCATG